MIILPLLLPLCAVLQAGPPQPPAPPSLTRFLQQSIGFDQAQLAAVQRGEAVVKVLEARDRRDVVVFGIATTAVSRAVFLQQARDIPRSLRSPSRTQLGVFSNPPSPADASGFTVNARDVEEMED